jgi:predicted aspartyl protease
MRRPIIALGLLAGPAGWLARGAPPEAGLEVPFDFLHNQIVLSVTIDGRGPFHALLDSGTHSSTIDSKLARRLKLKPGPAVRRAVGVGRGKVQGYQTVCRQLRIGDLTVGDLPAAVLDLSKISREMGRPLHAVLGFNFLDSRIVQIDYFRRRIRFPARFVPSAAPGRLSFPMQFRSGSVLPILEECYVNGTRIAVTLDTGSSLGLTLFPPAIALLGMEELARQGIALRATGYAGRAELTKGWVRSLALGKLALGAVEVAYALRGYGEGEDLARRGGNLGNAILQDFVLTLDYRHRVVGLEAVE